jgi:hypothetical protein
MTLGKQLQATIAALEQAKINKVAAQARADLAKVRFDRDADFRWLADTRDMIERWITENRVPEILVEEYDRRQWLETAQKGTARNQDLWDNFVQFFRAEELTVMVNDKHDGQGIADWKTITVALITS